MLGMDWSYVAGFFDGEGYSSIPSAKRKARGNTSVNLAFTNTDIRALQAIHDFIGDGSINPQKNTSKPEYKRTIYATKPYFRLQWTHRDRVLDIAKKILPYSIIKKEQLTGTITYIENRKWQPRPCKTPIGSV